MVILAGGLATRWGYLTKDPTCIFCGMYSDPYSFIVFPEVTRYFESQDNLTLTTVYENNDRFVKSNTVLESNLVSRYDKRLAEREQAEEPR